MAGRIPQSFIDELLNRIDVIDVIDVRVPLKKAGSNYKACCPFHTEKTPSFTVSQTKQFYHCFGCGANGTAISFLMEYEHLSFVDAIEDLAQQAGLEVEREQGHAPVAPREDNLYEIMLRAHDFYKQQLRSHAQSEQAIAYLKTRGMSGEIAAEFGVGYAPPGWDSLIQKLGKDTKSLEQLNRAGLVIEKDNNQGYYDRFRERIMIPITDRRGRVIAFGGRILNSEDAHGPKYLNSPETPIFHKGRELYGLYECRKAIRNPEKILVVEGYMDVLALAQYGIRYAVATLGTATTKEHLETLFRVVPRIIFCFDGDRAGREAAWRALENALPNMHEGREAAFLFLPDGEDPDSMVRDEGQAAFESRIDQAMPLSKFLLEHFAQQVDLSIPDGRARLVKLVKPFLQKIPDKVFRHMMFNQLASMVNMRVQQLENLIETASQPAVRTNKPAPKSQGKRPPVRQAINLILHNPQITEGITDYQFLQQADIQGAQLLHELLEILIKEPHLNTAALLERWRDKPESVHLLKLAANPLPGDAESLAGELSDIISFLGKQLKSRRWEILQDKLASTGLSESELIEWNQLLIDNSGQNT
ncbi:MAG: DNA primase [Gammaproteobacteria bacterium]|nr:DNA primase [Gammaproteobacteria bacterium]